MASAITDNSLLKKPQSRKRRRVRVGDPDFAAPDGGWGWLVLVACGFSNLSTFPMFQQFGLVFRERFEHLEISNSETTTIININSAFNAGVGLLNGPLFKTFSYRQVALGGATLVSISLFLSTFCESFLTYLIIYAICYGSGIGITQSANSLALNTYFKEKRRIATGLSWTTTGLGPIVWPYIITALNDMYGMQGTLFIFSAFAGHAIVCSLLLQPVHWHTKYRDEAEPINSDKDTESGYFEGKITKSSKSRSILSSRYLFNEDDPTQPGYEVVDPGTPRMVHANDGWYSRTPLAASRLSLASTKTNKMGSRVTSNQNSCFASRRASYKDLQTATESKERKRKISHNYKPAIAESLTEELCSDKPDAAEHDNLLKIPGAYPNEKYILKSAAKRLAEYKEVIEPEVKSQKDMVTIVVDDDADKKYSIREKIVIFFDLDLFKDPTYLNIMLGITIANFWEINFSILTPFVLQEFEFEKYQTATFMSLLGATDIVIRFFVPFVADKIGWSNRIFFLIGVLSMAAGRILLVHTRTFTVSLAVAVIIGAGKGLRTIFMALVIPSHVPLERLPGASGLQLATSGLLFLVLGPVVGWIREISGNYIITLHILNMMTYATAVSWTVEWVLNKTK